MLVSVILCTHNPRRDYLDRVLGALRAQTLPPTAWELVIIDNRSDAPLAGMLDLTWHAQSRVLREERLGLSNARAKGITESSGDILIFVDDDNVLDFNYIEEATRIAAQMPQLAIWGGSSVGEFEVPPPEALRPHLHCLALRDIKTQEWSKDWTQQECEPHGAGLCIGRSAAVAYREYYLQSNLRVSDRTGTALSSGGDTEMAFFVCRELGLGMGVFPQLRLTHLIPASRLTESYIARIAEGLEMSSMLLFYKWGKTMPPSPYAPRNVLRFLKHSLFSRGLKRELALNRLRAARKVRKMIAAESATVSLPTNLSVSEA